MINGLGVLGWGVGGIEAEAAMLGQPISMLIPQVVGFKLKGKLQPQATATDLVLTITQLLRKKGVVGKFVEFFGNGVSALSLADRATIANMAPEYGATMGFFPVDMETHSLLTLYRTKRRTNGSCGIISQSAGHSFKMKSTPEPEFSDIVELDLSTVEPSIAGPQRPHDRVPLSKAKISFRSSLVDMLESRKSVHSEKRTVIDKASIAPWLNNEATDILPSFMKNIEVKDTTSFTLHHGSVVIAAITSCTNTSNPSVLIAAGLLAKKAAEKGLKTKPWVKTSLAPGSKVVTEYLKAAGLTPSLEALGFHLVGYGCTTCIGNSGPLPEHIVKAIQENELVAAAVLSGNRNFEGRVNPHVRANYLASPPLVVAYALAGTMDIDFAKNAIGTDQSRRSCLFKGYLACSA